MVAGSSYDRWNSPLIPDQRQRALLAHVLTAHSFITLRYDKRASGPHVRENMQHLMGKISMQGHLKNWLVACACSPHDPT
jgi:ABC-type thiamine transport system ATPase subunit